VAKVNALVDPEMIELLYDANAAGVTIDCIIRGACSLHPGLPGRSDRITVRSIIGEFLEHSRIFGFANGGRQEWYTGSADLMERNLDRRIEVIFPIEDLGAQARIEEIIEVMLADDRRSWQLGTDASWRRTEEILGAPGGVDTFAVLKERALAGGRGGDGGTPPGSAQRLARSAGLGRRMAIEHVELELKYRIVDPTAATRLAAIRSLGAFRAVGRARQVQIEDRYLDTADLALGHAGYAVRLRRGPSMTVISVKSTTPAATALHRREELEGPAGLSLDPHSWPPSAARSLVLEHAGEAPLMELVTVRQLRRTRTLADEASEVELSLDEVAVVTGGRVVDRFLELELELRRGSATALDALATVLAADADLVPETASKLERALAAAGGPRGRRGRQGNGPGEETAAGDADGHAAEGSAAVPRGGAADAAFAASPPTGSAAVDAGSLAVAAPTTPAPVRLVTGKTPGVTADDVLAEAGRKVLPSTSPGCSPRRTGRVRARRSRTSMACAWRPAGCGPPGGLRGRLPGEPDEAGFAPDSGSSPAPRRRPRSRRPHRGRPGPPGHPGGARGVRLRAPRRRLARGAPVARLVLLRELDSEATCASSRTTGSSSRPRSRHPRPRQPRGTPSRAGHGGVAHLARL